MASEFLKNGPFDRDVEQVIVFSVRLDESYSCIQCRKTSFKLNNILQWLDIITLTEIQGKS